MIPRSENVRVIHQQPRKTSKSAFEELDDIVDIKEDNFFINKRNKEPFNIFELKFNPNSPMFQSGREQLQNLNFSFDSMSSFCHSAVN